MRLTHDGLSLWYGTPDAPAPFEQEVVPRSGALLVVGVHPANPTNSIVIHYRVDRGPVETVPGRELRVDYDRNCHYFTVRFPTFVTGDHVTYSATLHCGGRQVPAAEAVPKLSSSFRLMPIPSAAVKAPSRSAMPALALCPELSFLANVTVHFARIDYVGETPEGVRIDFYGDKGGVSGPSFNGVVLPGAADHMYVRRDGIGVIRVRAVIATDDGAKLEVEDSGSIDFGADGYARALAHELPAHSTLFITPRILTGHPKYAWLNRVLCLGVGRTNLAASVVAYQFYSVGARSAAHR